MKIFISALLVVGMSMGVLSCKDKPRKQPQKPVTKVVQKPLKDTLAADSLKQETVKEETKKPEPPKPEDKYFLIAGSFKNRENAELFRLKLEKEGYTSEIIERPNGPNNRFYKVSYKSFNNKNTALAELRNARQNEGKNHVWLLIKK